MAFDTKKFLVRFIEEARNHISRISAGLLSLETTPTDKEIINTIFRCAHTIKGSATMMNLQTISDFAHEIENNLSVIRDGSVVIGKKHIDLLLTALDQLSLMIDMAENQQEPEPPAKTLLEKLKTIQKPETKTDIKTETEPQKIETGEESPENPPEQRKRERISPDAFLIKTEKIDDLIKLVSEISLWNRSLEQKLKQVAATIKISDELYEAERDKQYNRIPELVNQLKTSTNSLENFLLHDAATLGTLNTELQETLFNLRLVPIRMIFEKFPRVVREIAAKFDKDIEFTMSGENTELDKKIVEIIDESLIQIIRNAIDHGIEPTDTREKKGKSAKGHIHVTASYYQGMCRITISDDGAGIQIDKLLKKAVLGKLLTEADAEQMKRNPTPEIIADLVFTPGLSASDIITDLSGRGVGMDIVQDNIIHTLNGTLQVSTQKDKGTTFTIMLPINTAILNVTRFKIGTIELAIPTYALTEIVQVEASKLIEVVDRTAIRLREQIIPVVRLDEIMKQDKTAYDTNAPFLLIIKTGTGLVAVIADEIITQDTFMIHALPKHLQHSPWVSGCIITDRFAITHLINTNHLMEFSKYSRRPITKSGNTGKQEKGTPAILVVDDSISTRDIEKSILESYGFMVDIAPDGEKAFEMTQEYQYDLIITDIEMPVMDGFTLVKTLRGTKSYRYTPIILVSSRDSEADKIRGIQVGADAYIVKSSFDQEDMIKTIKALIK